MSGDLDGRVRRLEDLEAIRQLKARYCRSADRGYDGAGDSPEAVAALFAEDGSWGGVHGQTGIRSLFEGFRASLPFSMHLVVAPEIEVDGDTAHGRWAALICLVEADGSAIFAVGVYEDRFVRTAHSWRFAELRFSPGERFTAGARVTMQPDG